MFIVYAQWLPMNDDANLPSWTQAVSAEKEKNKEKEKEA